MKNEGEIGGLYVGTWLAISLSATVDNCFRESRVDDRWKEDRRSVTKMTTT